MLLYCLLILIKSTCFLINYRKFHILKCLKSQGVGSGKNVRKCEKWWWKSPNNVCILEQATLLYYLKHCIDQKWPWYRVDAVFEIVKKKSRPPSHKHLGQARKSRCMRAPINSLATLYNIFAKYELHSFKMVLLRCTHPRNVRARQKI